jgi:large subunit ribosomal protein L23
MSKRSAYDVIVSPVITEKSTLVSEANQVIFKVAPKATKPEIKAAVELLFKVEVDSVQTAVQKGKAKKFGRSMGRRDHVKKAYVGLKAGQELNFSGEGA